MKLIEKHSRKLQLKKGNKIIFEILISKSGKRFHSFQRGLGIVSECKSVDECIEKTFERFEMMNKDFQSRMITI